MRINIDHIGSSYKKKKCGEGNGEMVGRGL